MIILKCKCILFIILFSIFCNAALAKKKPRVKITVESKPSDCTDLSEVGDTVIVHYTGALEDGKIFDTSRREGRQPFEVTLGEGKVIPGWEQGLLGMCGGEVRKLIVPSGLAYGDQGVEGVIPPKATLVFNIEVLELKKKSSLPIGFIPSGSGFYIVLGVVAVCCLIVYELYKRSTKQNEDAKKHKKKGKRNRT